MKVLALCLAAGALGAADTPEKPPPAARTSPVSMTDAQAAEQAKAALAHTQAELQKEALKRLDAHRFKSSRAPEREAVLFAMGVLKDRLGDNRGGAQVLRKLESLFPRSTFLPDCQLIIAQDDVDRRRMKEAETRLRRALVADLPAESMRKAQELLLWTLVEQNRASEGLDIVNRLSPLGTTKPSETGLVAILAVLCHHKKREEAEGIRNSYRSLYGGGTYAPRVELAWGRLLGVQGDAKPSAEVLAELIKTHPRSPESDEARLALAALLSDGKLQAQEAAAFPTPDQLLGELNRTDRLSDQGKRTLLLKLQLALQRGQWKEALVLVTQFRQTYPRGPEPEAVAASRASAVRNLVQQHLEKKDVAPLLDLLDGEAIQSLTPEQRKALVARFARVGLPEAARSIAQASPAKEQAILRRSILDDAPPPSSPGTTLALLPAKGESAFESLRRAQALVARQDWEALPLLLPRATPGAERITVLVAYLHRPLKGKESPAERRKEAEAWLSRAPERGPGREPLALLVADLRMQAGDWKGALTLYPEKPEPRDRPWVMLMRAQALARLGKPKEARAALETIRDEAAFRAERQALAAQLGR